jgi:hypothetical protein
MPGAKTKKPRRMARLLNIVPRDGIEPPTRGFSILRCKYSGEYFCVDEKYRFTGKYMFYRYFYFTSLLIFVDLFSEKMLTLMLTSETEEIGSVVEQSTIHRKASDVLQLPHG